MEDFILFLSLVNSFGLDAGLNLDTQVLNAFCYLEFASSSF